ncbi:TetR/AcrR family transcriptional regulator [Actinomadura sp. NTSP31]|uniref:TetR/AcrR family transcriptional regulator n=1 Tax=Actinomadura sp. NTSP31 TaxID=1735447 RepID=UPI0035C1E49C
MTPPENLLRRRALADAAIEILGTRGIHQLSHRAVDDVAGVPAGTASNYFRNRDGLLQAAARRAVELHLQEMRQDVQAGAGSLPAAIDREGLADLIGQSLYRAATLRRTRFQAVFELALEATRSPALGDVLSGLAAAAVETTIGHHRTLGFDTDPEQVQALITLYSGTLFTLVTGPPQAVTPDTARTLAGYMVNGVLGGVDV